MAKEGKTALWPSIQWKGGIHKKQMYSNPLLSSNPIKSTIFSNNSFISFKI